MRNLDNFESILDNDKNFLHGKLLFCQKGTTTPEAVYSWDSEHNEYVAITPIVYTDVNGRTDVQVFLADKDYTIYVYKYIGNGDMSLDSDDDNWSFQYSYNDVFGLEDLNINSDSLTLIDRMESLKATDPNTIPSVDGKKIIALCGYQTLGDCPAVYYRWSEVSTATANDVDVVAVAGITTGRWLLINTFNETGIFDVRHAGCFPNSDESLVDVTQSYALKKADTYAQKFGLTLFVPSIFENDNSYYIGTNITIWSPIWFADGAKIVTATSLTLDILSERNVDRIHPFILHSSTNNGSINVAGDIVHSSWFENTDTTNPSVNYPPFINVRKKFVYDGSFGALGIVPSYSFSNIDVEILEFLENEKLEFTNCNIKSDGKIKKGCSFIECEIDGGFFYSGAMFTDNSFTDCTSDIDTWSNTDWYVTYCENNGNTMLDLKYRECTLDFGSRATFPFKLIRNAYFSDSIKIPSGTILNIWDSQINSIVIDDVNSTIETIRIRNSEVTFHNNGVYILRNCKLNAEGSRISSDSGHTPIFKSARLVDCTIDGNVKVTDTITKLDVIGCEVNAPITAACTSSFNITFDQNVIKNNAMLVLESGSSLTKFVTSSFCNNVIQESGEREFIDFSGVAGFDVDDIGTYRYENNSGVEKGCGSISKHFHVKYRKTGNTDTGNYVLQTPDADVQCTLEGDGFKLNNLLFNFGEKTPYPIRVYTDENRAQAYLYFQDDGIQYSVGHAESPFVVYDAGIDGDTQILGGTFGSIIKDIIVVNTSYADETFVDFVLNVGYIRSGN